MPLDLFRENVLSSAINYILLSEQLVQLRSRENNVERVSKYTLYEIIGNLSFTGIKQSLQNR